MAVKGLAGDAQLPAKLADDRLPLPHRGHGQAQFGGCHLVLAAALAPACAGRRQAYLGTLRNKLPFKLRQGGEDVEYQLAFRGCCVDRCSMFGEYLKSDASGCQVTDLDVAISNECGRLVANIVIAYNSILLSGILNRYQAVGNQKSLELLMRISPVAWQHIHFLGHYAFRDKQHPIDLAAILACVNLQ